jgi:hypothetical protein
MQDYPEVSADRCRADQPAELRTTLMIHRKLFGALAVVVALPLTVATQIPASASTVASASSLAKDLLPASYANKVGFTKVTENVTTFKTGKKSCPLDAEEEFENAQGKLDLISGAATCTTSQGAATTLRSAESATSATSASPPEQLGSSAIERTTPSSVYEIYWLRGRTLEVVEILAASPTSSHHHRPITSAQQKILSSAAVEQNGLVARITT